MTTPAFEEFLRANSKPVSGEQPQVRTELRPEDLNVSVPRTGPVSNPAIVVRPDADYVPRAGWGELASHIGNMSKLLFRTFVPEYDDDLSFTENARLEQERMLQSGEVKQAFSEVASGLGRSIQYLGNAYLSPEGFKRDLRSAAMGMIDSTSSGISGAISNPLDALQYSIPNTIKGMLDMVVTPTLTMASGLGIENGEVVPASSEEMVRGVTTTLGNVVAGGVYTKLAKTLPAVRTAEGVNRVGVIASNIAREYPAMVGSNIAQEAIANPEEFSMEAIINNLANPVVLALTAGVGYGRGRAAINTAKTGFQRMARATNPEIVDALPSAKQVAVTRSSTFAEALAAVDALSIADNWLEAGIERITKARDGVFYITQQMTPESVQQLWKDYGARDILYEKPDLSATKQTWVLDESGRHTYFDNAFDWLVYKSDDLTEVAKVSDISIPALKKHQAKLRAAVDDTATYKVASSKVGDKTFKYQTIPDIPLPAQKIRPRMFVSKEGEVMFSMRPLAREQVDFYSNTGFLPNEKVVWEGMEGTVESFVKGASPLYDKVRVRLDSGGIATVGRKEISHITNGSRTVWNKRAFTDSMAEDAARFLSSNAKQGTTFSSIMERFAAERKWDMDTTAAFETYMYQYMKRKLDAAEAAQPLTPEMDRFRRRLQSVNKILKNEQKDLVNTGLQKVNSLGYRIEPSTSGYTLVDFDGNVIGRFNTADEIANMANRDFFTGDVPVLLEGNIPLRNIANKQSAFQGKLKAALIWFKNDPYLGQTIRPMIRRAEDIAELVGAPEIGTKIGFLQETRINAINAAESGIFRTLVDGAKRISNLARKITREQREQITIALQKMSDDEIRQMIGPANSLVAEDLFTRFAQVGGTDKVLHMINEIREGNIPLNKVDPKMIETIEYLKAQIQEGVLENDGIMRLVQNLENGDNLKQADYIARQNWDRNTFAVFEEAKKLFAEAAVRFEIPELIIGYAPWIKKWDGLRSSYAKNVASPDSVFIHELKRIGLSEQASLVTEIDDLVYSYVKSGIHHKSPVPSLKTNTGELHSVINREIAELARLGGNVVDLEQWVRNLKGAPDQVTANSRVANQLIDKIFGTKIRADLGGTLLDLTTLKFLAGRPIMGLRDVITATNISLAYGYKAAGAVLRSTPEKRARIRALKESGDFPQIGTDQVLARENGLSGLNKAIDLGMKASLQPQSYEMIAGNMYLHTYDEAIKAFKKAQGNKQVLMDELGDLLDGGSIGSQQFFLETAMRDPVTAAKFLASRNAGNVAGRFGRLNNPITWQVKYGRVFGQFASWNVNALNTYAEILTNARSPQAAARKFMRMAAFSLLVDEAFDQVGLDAAKWVLNPLGLLPRFAGPALELYQSVVDGLNRGSSANPYESASGFEKVMNATQGVLTPSNVRDLQQGQKIWEETGNGFLQIMRSLGFKLNPME